MDFAHSPDCWFQAAFQVFSQSLFREMTVIVAYHRITLLLQEDVISRPRHARKFGIRKNTECSRRTFTSSSVTRGVSANELRPEAYLNQQPKEGVFEMK